MRAFVVVFCVVALFGFTLSSPRRYRQIIPDDSDISPERLPGEVDNRQWWNNGNVNRPTRPTRPSRPTRPTAAPTQPPSPSPPSKAAFDRCMSNCLRTPQYDPLCASLMSGARKTYTNRGEMMCAEFCGETSTLLFRGTCGGLL